MKPYVLISALMLIAAQARAQFIPVDGFIVGGAKAPKVAPTLTSTVTISGSANPSLSITGTGASAIQVPNDINICLDGATCGRTIRSTTTGTVGIRIDSPGGTNITLFRDVNIPSGITLTSANSTSIVINSAVNTLLFNSATAGISGSATDGATAVGMIIDNANTLSNASAKLLSLRNNTAEKLSADTNGVLTQNGNVVQDARIAATCSAGQAVTAISSNAAATCTSVSGGLGLYGDGSDGTTTSVCCGSLAANCTLTRDVFCSSLTTGANTVTTAGYRLFVSGTLTISSGGLIVNNGNAGANGGSGASGGGGGAAVAANTVGGGTVGGTATTTNGGAATNQTNGFGGAGGAGGASGANTAGAAGTLTAPAANIGSIRALPQAGAGILLAAAGGTASVTTATGGAGGGSGAGDSTNRGGGGGSGAGVVIINARTVVQTGNIQANGGAGGNGTVGNAAGGGGGGGGLVILNYATRSGAGTITASGGALGTGVGTGGNGVAGSAGTTITLQN